MRHPMLLIVEGDGRLAGQLRPVAEQHRWTLHEPRRPDSCLRLLRRGGPAVLVLKAGRDLERELGLLERAARLFPEVGTVLVGDVDHPALAGLAWDLGVDCVLFPPSRASCSARSWSDSCGPAERWIVPDLPLLNEARCSGCGDCVTVCPTGCLEMAGGAAVAAAPA